MGIISIRQFNRKPPLKPTNDALIQLYYAGFSLRDIEKLTGLSHMTVYRRLKKLGVAIRKR